MLEPSPDALPRTSGVETLGTLAVRDPAFSAERPLFSADASVAHDEGGPLTRAFLDLLPSDFQRERLVVDSMLVWLQAGQGLPTRWFHHEVFPGKTKHAWRDANAEPTPEHVACAFGAPSVREFLCGELPDADLFCVEPERFAERDARLRGLRAAGALSARAVLPGALHRYRAGTFHRVLPTATPGFHFFVRATRGTRRPVVNGARNLHRFQITGPWAAEFVP